MSGGYTHDQEAASAVARRWILRCRVRSPLSGGSSTSASTFRGGSRRPPWGPVTRSEYQPDAAAPVPAPSRV